MVYSDPSLYNIGDPYDINVTPSGGWRYDGDGTVTIGFRDGTTIIVTQDGTIIAIY